MGESTELIERVDSFLARSFPDGYPHLHSNFTSVEAGIQELKALLRMSLYLTTYYPEERVQGNFHPHVPGNPTADGRPAPIGDGSSDSASSSTSSASGLPWWIVVVLFILACTSVMAAASVLWQRRKGRQPVVSRSRSVATQTDPPAAPVRTPPPLPPSPPQHRRSQRRSRTHSKKRHKPRPSRPQQAAPVLSLHDVADSYEAEPMTISEIDNYEIEHIGPFPFNLIQNRTLFTARSPRSSALSRAASQSGGHIAVDITPASSETGGSVRSSRHSRGHSRSPVKKQKYDRSLCIAAADLPP